MSITSTFHITKPTENTNADTGFISSLFRLVFHSFRVFFPSCELMVWTTEQCSMLQIMDDTESNG